MNVLLINLTRFGDLLQSAAAIRVLARGTGGSKNRIGMVCLENFVSGAELLPDLEDVYPLPMSKTMAAMDNYSQGAGCKPETAWMNGFSTFRDWVGKVTGHFAPDTVCNLSPTFAAGHLSRLLAGKRTLSGFVLNDQSIPANPSPWATFMQGSTLSRGASPFHVVDLFRKIAGDREKGADASLLPPSGDMLASMRERLAASSPAGTRGYVAIQLGASKDIRRWPVASFAHVGDMLWKKYRLLPLLLGSRGEIPFGEEYAAIAGEPSLSLMGKTSIPELAAAVSHISLLISNDTGTLHLASGLGVPVIGIFLATAQAWDTGPYAVNSCSLEPDLACHPCGFDTECAHGEACHKAIRPQTVAALAEARISGAGWDRANIAGPDIFQGSRIWVTTRDNHGFADLASVSGHDNDPRSQWMRIQRHFYRQLFDRNTAAPFVPEPAPTGMAVSGQQGIALGQACDTMASLYSALAQQTEMLLSNPLPVVRDRFEKTWDRLTAAPTSIPDFKALSFVWRNEVASRDGLENILPLMHQYHALFTALRKTMP